MNNEFDELMEIFNNSKFVFGLVNQGHIPTIEKMLKESKTWDEIGKQIGWCPNTAKEYYEKYLQNEKL
jgi:hypothetical protein